MNQLRIRMTNWLLRHYAVCVELGLIVAWTLFVGRPMLNFDLTRWPNGREFGMAIHPHFIWTQLAECGDCVLWNGFFNGGSPAFVELHAAVLHPLVILSTALFGGINGAKVIIVGSLLMAGLAQWWLGLTLELGRVARVWTACVVVAAGHLNGKLEMGVVGLIVSMAACSLLFPPLLALLRRGSLRDQQLFAAVFALLIVSGQGYLQIGMLLVLPLFAFLLIREREAWTKLGASMGLGGWLAGVFLIPFLHFYPNFGKDADPYFASSQPLEWIPLNLVIGDTDFYLSTALQKLPYGYLYLSYIGWVPVLLAVVGLYALLITQQKRLAAVLVLAIGAFWFIASALPFRWAMSVAPDLAAIVRNPIVIAGLSVPLVLVLAGFGVDYVAKQPYAMLIAWLDKDNNTFRRLYWSHVLLLPLLVWSLFAVYEFSQKWLFLVEHHPETHTAAEAMDSETAQWVALPHGQHFWGAIAAAQGMKTTNEVRPAFWSGRSAPAPSQQLAFNPPSDSYQYEPIANTNYHKISYPTEYYAFVDHGNRQTPCTAVAKGGHIDVSCEVYEAGTLVVRENAWTGWEVAINGVETELLPDVWLATPAFLGRNEYQFRYRPWDVRLGLAASLIGILGLIYYQVQIVRGRRAV